MPNQPHHNLSEVDLWCLQPAGLPGPRSCEKPNLSATKLKTRGKVYLSHLWQVPKSSYSLDNKYFTKMHRFPHTLNNELPLASDQLCPSLECSSCTLLIPHPFSPLIVISSAQSLHEAHSHGHLQAALETCPFHAHLIC